MCKIVNDFKNELKITKDTFDEALIENFSKRLNEEFGMISYPIKIYDIASSMGFSTYKCNMDEPELSGIIAIDEKLKESNFYSDKVIAINESDNDGHQRFTVAHEIAHYIFDYVDTSIPYYNAYRTGEDNSNIEKRANSFAACLLMPKTLFKTQWDKYDNDKERTIYDKLNMASKEFKVSEEAVRRRYEEVYGKKLKLI